MDAQGRVVARHEGEIAVPDLLASLGTFLGPGGAVPDPDAGPSPVASVPVPTGSFRFPAGIVADAGRDLLVVADTGNHRLVVTGMDGRVRSIIGSGVPGLRDGVKNLARFRSPRGMAFLPDGRLAIADTGNHAVRSVDVAAGTVETISGTGEQARRRLTGAGPARETAMASPWDVAWFSGELWVAAAGTHQLLAIGLATGMLRPAAGSGAEGLHDGPSAEAAFAQPSALAVAAGRLYVADAESSAIRQVDPATGRVRRLVGRGLFDWGDHDGIGDAVRLQHPLGLAASPDASDPTLYIADTYNGRVKRFHPGTRAVERIFGGGDGEDGEAGDRDGAGMAARFRGPSALAVVSRRVFIADTDNGVVRIGDLTTGRVSILRLAT
ncbi:MAG: alkyl hydroperoxide reductase [Chloroflexota bacterium]|nr:alkyl hydroperoxide reductase [Chloroflexota bacterium]